MQRFFAPLRMTIILVSRQHQLVKMMHVGVPTGVYWPVKWSKPVRLSIRNEVI